MSTLKVPVRGGTWKAGRLMLSGPGCSEADSDCCLIGEAVAPGFDFHDFAWVTPRMLQQVPDGHIRESLAPFLHEHVEKVADSRDATIADADQHYVTQ